MGKITVHFGTMKSGKSLDIIRTQYNYTENGFKVLLMKPAIDIKGGDCVKTRIDDKTCPCDFLIDRDTNILNLLNGKLENIRCILIDESQFLTSKQVLELLIIAKSADIDVICYSLRTNFMMKAFEGSIALFEKLEHMDELITVCECGDIARHAARKINGEFVSEGEEVVIDGENTSVEYVQICAKCYLEKVMKIDLQGMRRKLLYGDGESNK